MSEFNLKAKKVITLHSTKTHTLRRGFINCVVDHISDAHVIALSLNGKNAMLDTQLENAIHQSLTAKDAAELADQFDQYKARLHYTPVYVVADEQESHSLMSAMIHRTLMELTAKSDGVHKTMIIIDASLDTDLNAITELSNEIGIDFMVFKRIEERE